MEWGGSGEDSEEDVCITPRGSSRAELRISCSDATGLGCDVARLMLEYGLSVVKGDFSTDGKWCFLLFLVAWPPGETPQWTAFRSRLKAMCTPEYRGLPGEERKVARPEVALYLLQVETNDKCSVLFNVMYNMYENDISVHRAHASTTPMGRVVDIFYVVDNRRLLPDDDRVEDIIKSTRARLRDRSATVSLTRAPSVVSSSGAQVKLTPGCIENRSARPALPLRSKSGEQSRRPSVTEDSMSSSSEREPLIFGDKVEVDIDNNLSKVHTVLQMRTRDRKGLLYDLLRTLKDVNTQVSYGKIEVGKNNTCRMDVFIQEVAGTKTTTQITDPELQQELCISVHHALACPVRISVWNRGSGDGSTQLTLATSLDSGGKGRPRVLLDASRALKKMSLSIFKMDMFIEERGGTRSDPSTDSAGGGGGGGVAEQQFGGGGTEDVKEIYRFIITDSHGSPIAEEKLFALAESVHDALMEATVV